MDERRTVLATSALKVEWLRCELGPERTAPSHTAERQVLFPLAGTFRWHVGRTTSLLDPNHVMFVETDEESWDTHPTGSTVTCLIATVATPLARRLWRSSAPFAARTTRASSRLQADYTWFAAAITNSDQPAAVWEERAVQLLADATAEAGGAAPPPRCAATELARRAKELFGDHGELLSLAELAELLDVSPAHLTASFCRAEGVPIVRYQIQLRIMRALRELPYTNDLAALAVELGFASHSHFSTAFRARIGVTPSQFRAAAQRGDSLERIRKRVRAAAG